MQSDHRRHDRLLVARYAADDSHPSQLQEARVLVEACAECAGLAADIRLISRAVRDVPVPNRPRSFQLSAEQAERLRGSSLDRFLRRLAGTGWGTLRPVAGVALSLGLVMAAIGALPLGSMSGVQPALDRAAGQAPEIAHATDFAAPTSAPAGGDSAGPEDAPPAEVAQPLEDGLSDAYVQAQRDNSDGDPADPAAPGESPRTAAVSGFSPLLYLGLSVAVLAMGASILAWFARRRYTDPLMR